MKKKLVFFAFPLLIAAVAIHGQPAIKIFGYEQQSLPGTVPAGVKDENGNPIKKAAAKPNYLIFLSCKKNDVITPLQVFIKGSSFAADSFIVVARTPVEYINVTIPNHPQKTILVPKTSNKVIRIESIKSAAPADNSSHLKNLLKTNDVVIAYIWKHKKYYAALKKIIELDPVLHE